ncbi:MAG: undecaprenyldiphospho-muramoylpentapeptide beta-N-acetylglucosaminyltransferase [Legionellaceae bacterium]|nr:undecaprenyldiphospho-muramoylpentapeptide beta-N-acetylglucosaminyltransferase [Legionellaceae bacterium]
MRPVIVFTGGGTAGHVNPNLALIAALRAEDWTLHYIGSAQGPEAAMIPRANIPFHAVSSGKLRRYFSWQNFIDPFKTLWGIVQSWRILGQEKATLVFSKGGFVAFPVVVAAWLRRIPVIAHESDFSPGLANRLSYPFARKVCLTFAGTRRYFKNDERLIISGTPLRQGLDEGIKGRGLDSCGFKGMKPCLLFMGGSQGAASLNRVVRAALPRLLEQYQIIHICGPGKVDDSWRDHPGYCQFEYVDTELPHLLAAADVVISRAGANTLYELLALHKPHLLIPLPAIASRGDQIENARYFEEQGVSVVLAEARLNEDSLLAQIELIYQQKAAIAEKIKTLAIQSATTTIIDLIKGQLRDQYPAYSR